MTAITGKFLGSGVAVTVAGQQVAYRLVVPDKTASNLSIIATEAQRWQAIHKRYQEMVNQRQLNVSISQRAQFGEEVLAVVGQNLKLGVCCSLTAQALDGRILGTSSYTWWKSGDGGLNLQVIDPEHLAGSPGRDQLRGIGTALVAAVAQQMVDHGVTTLYLHPLDQAAAVFWAHRGFVPCGVGGRMCIRGQEGIRRLISSCFILPSCQDSGECLLCGTMKMTEAFRLPQNRER